METKFAPRYDASYALIIGVNVYETASPLDYAVNDAVAILDILKGSYGFDENNCTVLLNEHATRQNIQSAFLRYANDDVQDDDRIVVFYAGHGTTITGKRGEVGYLVPYDANLDDISTLLRWDELTRNCELIDAKSVTEVWQLHGI